VTRPEGQAGRLSDALRVAGADPFEVPAIRITAPPAWTDVDRAIADGEYDWVIFTSVNGVHFFVERLIEHGLGSAWFRGKKLAAIGPETARQLRTAGAEPDLVPDEYVAEALVACVAADGPLTARRVLLPRADIARDALAVGLSREGALVDTVVTYHTLPADPPPDLVPSLRQGQIHAATLTSSSTVRSLLAMLGGDAEALRATTVACIGPITAATAREAGLTPQVVATVYTIPGLVNALCEHFAQDRLGRTPGQGGAM
jgi:uroporphyrinogen III methyltransferase/synthase